MRRGKLFLFFSTMYDLKQKIVVSKGQFQNKTMRYLLPLLKAYGNIFIEYFYCLKIKFCGIADYNYNDELGVNLFVVIEVNNYNLYNRFLKFFKEQDYYVNDFIFSISNNLHCFVIKFPFPKIIEKFLLGKYSELLSKEDVNRFYDKTFISKGIEYYTPVYSIVTKKKEYRDIFLETVRKDFGATTDIEGDFEYDYPPILSMEILNYDEISD